MSRWRCDAPPHHPLSKSRERELSMGDISINPPRIINNRKHLNISGGRGWHFWRCWLWKTARNFGFWWMGVILVLLGTLRGFSAGKRYILWMLGDGQSSWLETEPITPPQPPLAPGGEEWGGSPRNKRWPIRIIIRSFKSTANKSHCLLFHSALYQRFYLTPPIPLR